MYRVIMDYFEVIYNRLSFQTLKSRKVQMNK